MRPSDGRISLWPAAVIGIVLILAALSITPEVKLKNVPPSDFVALRASAAGPNEVTAGRYWEVTTRVIQWKYSRTSALPPQAPSDFTLVDGTGKPDRMEDQAARAAYWATLRQDWLKPENWHTTYGVDMAWPLRSAKELYRVVMQFLNSGYAVVNKT